MSQWLKQSTAITLKLGPFLDDTDGKTAETGLTISQADVRLSKNGGDFAQKNEANAATHDENGYYDVALDTTDTNTLGRLKISVSESGALPVWEDFMVVPANVWDSMFGADYLQVDAVQVEGGDATDQINAACDTALADYDAPTKAEMDAGFIALNDPTAADIADAVLDEALAGHTGAGSLGKAIADIETDATAILEDTGTSLPATLSTIDGKVDTVDGVVDAILTDTAEIGAAGAGLSAIPWNASWDAEVQSEVQDAIEANHLDHLLAVDYDPASKPGVATALLNELVESDGGVSRFTANALEEAPTGGSAPTAGEIADAVWDEALADHNTEDSFGNVVNDLVDEDGGGVYQFNANALELAPTGSGSGDWTADEKEQIRYRLQLDGTQTAPATDAPLQMPVSADAVSQDETAADNLEAMLDGTRAKLYLSQLDIEASGDDAAIKAHGGDSGNGIEAKGGDIAGNGIMAYASADGDGINAIGAGGKRGIFAQGDPSTGGIGLLCKGGSGSSGYGAAFFGGSDGVDDVKFIRNICAIPSLATQAKADVNAEVDTALADYDPPTKAELDAAQAAIVADIAEVKAETASIQGDTNDIQARLPAALISGRIDANVGDMAADVITAAAIAPDAIGSSELAASAVTEIQSGLSTLTAAQVNTEVDQALADYDPPTKAEMDAGFTALHDISPAEVLAQVDTALDTAIAEPTAPFTWAQASIRKILGWIGALSRNRMTQTGSTTTLRNDANSANIATFAVSDDETTFVSDEAQ